MYERCCPEVQWVQVTDASGRRRMEMRWSVAAHAVVTAMPVPAQVSRAA